MHRTHKSTTLQQKVTNPRIFEQYKLVLMAFILKRTEIWVDREGVRFVKSWGRTANKIKARDMKFSNK